MKPRNPDRADLVRRIMRLANLPEGKKTLDYFTRPQLVELANYLEHVNAKAALVGEGKHGGN